jgi:hypothetical protein
MAAAADRRLGRDDKTGRLHTQGDFSLVSDSGKGIPHPALAIEEIKKSRQIRRVFAMTSRRHLL